MDFLTTSTLFHSFLTPALRVAVVLIIAFFANRLAKIFISKMTKHFVVHRDKLAGRLAVVPDEKRLSTLKKAFFSILSIVIWVLAVITLLPQFGIDIAPILAAVGVGGLALGLATQNIIRDYLAGIFILLEDQFRVGEEVEIAGQAGIVEDFNLRRTVLKNKQGEICYVPNNQIVSVVNLTRGLRLQRKGKTKIKTKKKRK